MAETSSSTISYVALNGGGKSGKLVGIIKNDTVSFPTLRPDGNHIKNEDYVKIDANAKLPITIEGITFENLTDQAYFFNNSWILKTQNSATINGVKVEGQKTGDQYGLINSKQGSENAGKVPMVNEKGDIEFVKIETSGKQNAYSSLVKLEGEPSGYTYKVKYGDIDYDYAINEFAKQKPSANFTISKQELSKRLAKNKAGGCTAFYFNGIIGRCFDWNFSNIVEFNVSTPAINGTYQVKGMAQNTQLTKQIVDSGAYSESYKLLPVEMVDGNNSGLYIASLVVPCERGYTIGTTPLIEKKLEIADIMIPRLLLDHFDNVPDAINFLINYTSIYNPMDLFDRGYDLHFLIADKYGNHGAIEFINNEIKYIDKVSVLTNFHVFGTTPNDDGTYFTPYDYSLNTEHDPITVNGLTAHASGVERYNLTVRTLDNAKIQDDIEMLLANLRFTNLYTTAKGAEDYRYSELVGEYNGIDYQINTNISIYNAEGGIVDKAIEEYGHRDRNTGTTWQTVHGGIFRFDNLTSYYIFQEQMELPPFEFTFDYYTKDEVNELISHISVDDALKINEHQSLTDEQYNTAHDNLQDGSSIVSKEISVNILNEEGLDVPILVDRYVLSNIVLSTSIIDQNVYNVIVDVNGETVNCYGTAKGDSDIIIDKGTGVFGNIASLNYNSKTQELVIICDHLTSTPNLIGVSINHIVVSRQYQPYKKELIPLIDDLMVNPSLKATVIDNEATNNTLTTSLAVKNAIDGTGYRIDLEINSSTFELLAKLYDKNNNLLSTSSTIDLPLEEMIINVSYDNTTKELVITLKSGQIVRIPLQDIISGLATQTYVNDAISNEDTILKEWANNRFITEHQSLDNYYTKEQVNSALNDKVNVEIGKGLSSNDFTNEEKEKLSQLENYDDTEVKNDIANLRTAKQNNLTTITGFDATKTQILKNVNGVLTWVDEPQKDEVDFVYEDSTSTKYLLEKK